MTEESKVHPRLQKLRKSKNLKLRKLKNLKRTYTYYDGNDYPLRLRYYQIQGTLHLVAMTRFILGDACGLGKTLESIAALCCLWDRNPKLKAVVLTTKSSVPEWRGEFAKFTQGIEVVQLKGFGALPPKKKSKWNLKKEEREVFKELFGKDYFEALKPPPLPEPPPATEGEDVLKSDSKEGDLSSLLELSSLSEEEKKKRMEEEKREKEKRKKEAEKREKKRQEFLDDICRLWTILDRDGEGTAEKGLMSVVESVGRSLASCTPVSSEANQRLASALKRHRIAPVPGRDRREKVYESFAKMPGPAVLVMNYRKAVIDYDALRKVIKGCVLILDEATAFKTTKSDTHKACRFLAQEASRVWGLTATLIQNRLEEAYGIYRVVRPDLFGTLTNFYDEYCITELQRVAGNRRIRRVVGHTKRQLKRFREDIDPYFLGRAKHEVASELPTIISKEIKVGLSSSQRSYYQEAQDKLLEVVRDGVTEELELTQLTQLIYFQEIVNHPKLIGQKGTSEKLRRLLDMVTEGDFAEEKIVIFSRFKRMINILEKALKKKGVKTVRITGDENDRQRVKAMEEFRRPDSKSRVALINEAGSMAINLQVARVFIFYDTPWSGGAFLQSFGRIDRIGSIYESIYCIHLLAEGTIDEKVIAKVRAKLRLFETAVGTKALRGQSDDTVVEARDDIADLFMDIIKDAQRSRHAT